MEYIKGICYSKLNGKVLLTYYPKYFYKLHRILDIAFGDDYSGELVYNYKDKVFQETLEFKYYDNRELFLNLLREFPEFFGGEPNRKGE